MAQTFGNRWEIVEKLAEGGQAETFLVRDLSVNTDDLCVLKRLKNLRRLPRFEQEVSAVRTLNHRNVLRLVDANTTAERPYLVSEYCRRGNLEANRGDILIAERDKRMALFEEICAGVAAAHRENIVHRDIKPANIFLRDDGTAVVGDFGLCFVETDERLTDTAEAVGARYYMAPELAEGRTEDVTAQVDVYSLGKTLYWIFTGRTFDRERHRHGKNNLQNYFPRDQSIEHLTLLLDKMIVEEPSSRFKDADDVLRVLPNVRRLLRGGYPALTAMPQICRYCGDGSYQDLSNGSAIRNFGINPNGVAELNMFVCENCGHVLMFRADMSNNKGWLPWRD